MPVQGCHTDRQGLEWRLLLLWKERGNTFVCRSFINYQALDAQCLSKGTTAPCLSGLGNFSLSLPPPIPFLFWRAVFWVVAWATVNKVAMAIPGEEAENISCDWRESLYSTETGYREVCFARRESLGMAWIILIWRQWTTEIHNRQNTLKNVCPPPCSLSLTHSLTHTLTETRSQCVWAEKKEWSLRAPLCSPLGMSCVFLIQK